MLSSMFSGISGLKANQKKLDVIGNNIANSSTTSFKSQRARFQDMISQNVGNATSATSNLGGTNPKQVGLGVQIAGIDTNTAQGSMQSTSRALDLAIDGEGYFVVGSGPVPATTSDGANGVDGSFSVDPTNHSITSVGVTNSYTRDGSLTLDAQGSLLTSSGLRVYGYANADAVVDYTPGATDPTGKFTVTITNPNTSGGADANVDENTLVPLVVPDSITDANGVVKRVTQVNIGIDGVLSATIEGGVKVALGQIAMTSFKNPEGLEKVGSNNYKNTANSGAAVLKSAAQGPANTVTDDNSSAYGDVRQGMLEMSNVDLAEQFTDMIIASRAFQANGKIISTGDEILQDLVNLKR